MTFYTITSDEGRFCGYHRRWHNLWRLRPEFRWDTMPWHGEAMMFTRREDALNYIVTHKDAFPRHVEVKENKTREP